MRISALLETSSSPFTTRRRANGTLSATRSASSRLTIGLQRFACKSHAMTKRLMCGQLLVSSRSCSPRGRYLRARQSLTSCTASSRFCYLTIKACQQRRIGLASAPYLTRSILMAASRLWQVLDRAVSGTILQVFHRASRLPLLTRS